MAPDHAWEPLVVGCGCGASYRQCTPVPERVVVRRVDGRSQLSARQRAPPPGPMDRSVLHAQWGMHLSGWSRWASLGQAREQLGTAVNWIVWSAALPVGDPLFVAIPASTRIKPPYLAGVGRFCPLARSTRVFSAAAADGPLRLAEMC